MSAEQGNPSARATARDWDANTYHRVSEPQVAWGRSLLDRTDLRGDEVVLDAGCGSGRLTVELLDRLPRGRVIAVDLSPSMLQAARGHLHQARPSRVARTWLVRADLASLPFQQTAHVIFSAATFHWVLNHLALFRSLYVALRPGGRLVAQSGGGPNLARMLARATALSTSESITADYDSHHSDEDRRSTCVHCRGLHASEWGPDGSRSFAWHRPVRSRERQ